MSSSTNPPTSTSARKFKFDLDFEEERIRQEAVRQAEAMRAHEEEAPPARIFNEEEMAQIQQEAQHAGYEQGLHEAKQSLEQTLTTLMDRATQKLHTLIEAEMQREHDVQETALRTALAAIKKFWPRFQESCSVELIEKTVSESLELNQQETRIVLRIHDSLMDAVISRLNIIKEQQGFAGKIIVLADDNLAPGDCKVEWADGGLERLSRVLSQQLDGAIERVLANLPTEQKTSDTERTSS